MKLSNFIKFANWERKNIGGKMWKVNSRENSKYLNINRAIFNLTMSIFIDRFFKKIAHRLYLHTNYILPLSMISIFTRPQEYIV